MGEHDEKDYLHSGLSSDHRDDRGPIRRVGGAARQSEAEHPVADQRRQRHFVGQLLRRQRTARRRRSISWPPRASATRTASTTPRSVRRRDRRWITGMYAISNGTQPMRSRNEIPHDKIPVLSRPAARGGLPHVEFHQDRLQHRRTPRQRLLGRHGQEGPLRLARAPAGAAVLRGREHDEQSREPRARRSREHCGTTRPR